MDDSKGETVAIPSLGISMELQYAGGRKVVFQTFVERDVDAAEVDALLDKLNGSADRAEAFYAQEQARRQLEVEENALANIVHRLSEVEGNMQLKATDSTRREYKPSTQEVQAKKQALDSVEESKRRVAACKAHLADLIKKAGNRDGASSPANS